MTASTAIVPVLHLTPLGEIVPGNPAHSPCVSILFSFALDMIHSGKAEGKTLALIDTGADVSVIDRRLIPAHARLQKEMPTVDIKGLGTAGVYLLEVSFKGSTKSHLTQVVAGDLSTRPYSMLLGRSLLQGTRFTYDGIAGISALEVL